MMLQEQRKATTKSKNLTSSNSKDSTVNKSCPKTPHHLVCSEGLSLRLAVTSESEGEEEEKDNKRVLGKRWNYRNLSECQCFTPCLLYSGHVPVNSTISDSFLERAMDSHMSEADYKEAETNIRKSAEKVKKCSAVQCSRLFRSVNLTFLTIGR